MCFSYTQDNLSKGNSMKQVKTLTVDAEEALDDLDSRLDQFSALADHATVSDKERRLYHEGQAVAFGAVRALIGQIRKRGDIWRGGYNDAEGKVDYEDQVETLLKGIASKA